MQKHSGICLFLVAAELKHNTVGNATLGINNYLGATLPPDLLGKALIGLPHSCKEFHEVGLVRTIGKE